MLLAIHCKGCFNPETWDFNKGEKYTLNTEKNILQIINKSYISRFSILGGEPLCENNINTLSSLISKIKQLKPDITIWLWSGYTWEQLQQRKKKDNQLQILFTQIDYIICGPFIEQEKDLTLLWRGSRNQEVIMCKKSIAENQKILYIE